MDSYDVQFNKNSQLKRKKTTKMLLVALLLIMIIIGIVITVLRKPFLFIQQVTITGSETLDVELLYQQTQNYLGKNKWLVIPQKNILIFSKREFSQWLEESFPSIKKSEIYFDREKNMTIEISERKPESLWCQNEQCFFIGYDGIIYRQAPRLSDGVFLKIKGPVIENPIGQSVYDFVDYASIQQLVADMKNNSVIPVEIVFGNPIKIYVHELNNIGVPRDSFIAISNDFSRDRIMETITLLFSDTVFIDTLSKKQSQFKSIDLTIDGKIYYTFDSPVATPVPTTPLTPNE